MPLPHTAPLAAALLGGICILMSQGCRKLNRLYDADDEGTSSGLDSSTGVGDATLATSGPASTGGGHSGDNVDANTGGGGASGDSNTSAETETGRGSNGDGWTDSSTGTQNCSTVAAAVMAYPPCIDAGCLDGACRSGSATPPLVFELSVCEASCDDDCDCPSIDDSPAVPRCNAGHCQLDCETEADCPDNMVCDEQLCSWAHAYGPCDETCPSPGCVSQDVEPIASGCPVLDCWDGGTLSDSLCPPPISGDAEPVCFEPFNFMGQGWCARSCTANETVCPAGTFCAVSGGARAGLCLAAG